MNNKKNEYKKNKKRKVMKNITKKLNFIFYVLMEQILR